MFIYRILFLYILMVWWWKFYENYMVLMGYKCRIKEFKVYIKINSKDFGIYNNIIKMLD